MTPQPDMVTATSSVSAADSGTSPRSSQLNAADSQDRFLKLLVAQLSNQDPLNPMDNAQLTTQMAQISTVSSLETVNRSITQLASQLVSMQVLQSSALVGHDVLVEGNALAVHEGRAAGAIDLPLAADSVKVDILTPGGQVVQTLDLGRQAAGRASFTWDASAHPGVLAPSFRVTATAAGKAMTTTSYVRDTVQAISSADGVMTLQLRGRGSVPYDAVKTIF